MTKSLSDFRVEVTGDCRLILGDCMEVMPLLGEFDVGVFDPPYGVNQGVGSGLRKLRKSKTDYGVYDDTVENFYGSILPAVHLAISKCSRCAITSGFKRMYDYPRPKHVGTFQYGAMSTVMSSWGPALWQPILYYGKDPYQQKLVPDSFQRCNDVDRTSNHPCPKPLKSWTRLVKRVSEDDDHVLDPFMGSGTTGVSCVPLGRRFTGIEIDPLYFAESVRRIRDAYKQRDLFVPQPETIKPVQEDLLK